MASTTVPRISGSEPPIVNDDKSIEASRLGNEAGALYFQTKIEKDPSGSAIPVDRSFIQLQDKFGTYVHMSGGKLIEQSSGDMGLYSGKDFYQFVQGDAQYHFHGDKHEYIQGNRTIQIGKQGAEQREAAEKLGKLADEISNAGIKEIESNAGEGDRIECPICAQEMAVDRASRTFATASKYLRKIFNFLPNSPLGGFIDKVEKILKKVIAFFLDDVPVSALNGGSCGSSGCKNNTIASPIHAIQKANEKISEKFEQNKKELEKLEKLASDGSLTESIPNDIKVHVGGPMRECETVALASPNPLITELKDGNPKYCFIPASNGTCKAAIYQPPIQTSGNEQRSVSNSYQLKVGSGGIDSSTSGKQRITGSTVEIATSKGELLLNSPNKTIIGGANIVLQSKGNPNGDAIILDSDRVYVGGKLSVQGDIALKGSLMMDGGIYAPHLTVPGERIDSEVSSSAHNVHSAANWNNPVKPDATKTDIFDKIYKIMRDIGATLMGLVQTPDYLKTKIEETYSTAQISMVVDNTFLPTGFAMVYDYTTYMPLFVFGTCTYGGAVTGYVLPAMIPVYTYTHNHGSPGDPHCHGYTMPKCVTHGNAAASIASRQPASSIPTPAQTTGMGSEPGHKNAGDLGPCGGGGGPFGNAGRVNSAKLRRNRAYGINSIDAFGGKDYIDTTETGVNVSYNPDGTTNPIPEFKLPDCD